jgi:dihydrofolate reductase
MGELVVTEFVTLDGVMEDPGGDEGTPNGGWGFKADWGPEGDAFKLAEHEAADAQLLGRVTYDRFAAAWPSMTESPLGERMNTMPKFVYSETLKSAEWQNTTILDGDLRAEVRELKERLPGGILVPGSRMLVQSLLALDLVDRLTLMVFPMVLGSGMRLFDDAPPKTLAVTSVRQLGEVVALTYARTGGGTAQAVPNPIGAPRQVKAA